jgi:hypothetical protein
VALLTFNLGLDQWLDGTLVGTIFSQTLDDWSDSYERAEGINSTDRVVKSRSARDRATQVLEQIKGSVGKNNPLAALILETFLADVKVKEGYVKPHWTNIQLKSPDKKLETILATLFTQNASPARLYRVWNEAAELWALALQEMKGRKMWPRLRFTMDSAKKRLKDRQTYVFKFRDLEPDTLQVLYLGDGEFLTTESLNKFRFMAYRGETAVRKALEKNCLYAVIDEESLKDMSLDALKVLVEEGKERSYYCPFITIVQTPLLFQIVVPATKSMEVLNMVHSLFSHRFAKVIGKLPLNVGLLVADRKFPLYLLLEAGRDLLQDREFEQQIAIEPWWDISDIRNDRFYHYYPSRRRNRSEFIYPLDALDPLSKGKPYMLYPGYFDFALIRGNEDCHNLVYEGRKRADEDYAILSARPCCFHEVGQMIDLWEILSNNLSKSQICFIEEALSTKKLEWRNIKTNDKKDILDTFGETVLLDAFEGKWQDLSEQARQFVLKSLKNNLLLDTIVLFHHIIKGEGVKG